jgi:hypothetical protein
VAASVLVAQATDTRQGRKKWACGRAAGRSFGLLGCHGMARSLGIIADKRAEVKRGPGSFGGIALLGFEPTAGNQAARAAPAAGSQRRRGFRGHGCDNSYLGFVCRISGSFVGILGSFVDFLGFRGFDRGFVRRKKAEMCRYTHHKHR